MNKLISFLLLLAAPLMADQSWWAIEYTQDSVVKFEEFMYEYQADNFLARVPGAMNPIKHTVDLVKQTRTIPDDTLTVYTDSTSKLYCVSYIYPEFVSMGTVYTIKSTSTNYIRKYLEGEGPNKLSDDNLIKIVAVSSPAALETTRDFSTRQTVNDATVLTRE
jgi:hypothetical protein